MASKDAQRARDKFLNSPVGAIVLVIAAIIALERLLFG